VPGRSASWGDVLADALGAAAGLLLARIIGVRGTYA
jgi:VanZ family protein